VSEWNDCLYSEVEAIYWREGGASVDAYMRRYCAERGVSRIEDLPRADRAAYRDAVLSIGNGSTPHIDRGTHLSWVAAQTARFFTRP
jgi:hypothetical protein